MSLVYVILAGGKSTRNYPQSKGIANKALLPLGSVRIIDRLIGSIIKAGGKEIIIVTSGKDAVKSFKEALKPAPDIEKKLKKNPKTQKTGEVLAATEIPKDVRIRYVIQKNPYGNGHAFGTACKKISGKDAVMIFSDDIYITEEGKVSPLEKLQTAFKTDIKQILLTGIERKDMSNYAALTKDRLVEKPKVPPNNIGIFSPMIFPKDLCRLFAKRTTLIDSGKDERNFENGKELVYVDVINEFLDTHEAKGYKIKALLKDAHSRYMDTGNLPSYEQALLYALLHTSAFKEENKAYLKEIQ